MAKLHYCSQNQMSSRLMRCCNYKRPALFIAHKNVLFLAHSIILFIRVLAASHAWRRAEMRFIASLHTGCVCVLSLQNGWTARDAFWGQTHVSQKPLRPIRWMEVHISATWRIRWIVLCSCGDAGCRYLECSISNLLVFLGLNTVVYKLNTWIKISLNCVSGV